MPILDLLCRFTVWAISAYTHVRTMNFYVKLIALYSSPASLLFKLFAKRDFDDIAAKYNILLTDKPFTIRHQIKTFFDELASTSPSNWWHCRCRTLNRFLRPMPIYCESIINIIIYYHWLLKICVTMHRFMHALFDCIIRV